MATIAEILAREDLFEPRIYLYKEGVFWKAYQQSAYLVDKLQGGFKLHKRFVKNASRKVVSLGFPQVTLERIFNESELVFIEENIFSIKCSNTDKLAYDEWFNAIDLFKPATPTSAINEPEEVICKNDMVVAGISTDSKKLEENAVTIQEKEVLELIRDFHIEESTPMDCINFLASIRKQLK